MVEPEVWRLEGHIPEVSGLVPVVVGFLWSQYGLFWIQGLTLGSSGFVPPWDVSPWCLPPVVGIGMGWGREQGSPECVPKYWSRWELGLLEGWLVGVEIGVVFLVPPYLYLRIVPMYHRQSDRYVKMWTSFPVTSCQSGNTVKTCIML